MGDNYFSLQKEKCNYFQRNKIIIVNIFNVIAILEPHKTLVAIIPIN